MLNVESKEGTIDGVNRAKLFLEANGRSKIIEGLQQHDNGTSLFLLHSTSYNVLVLTYHIHCSFLSTIDEVRKLSTDILIKYSRR